MKPLGRLFFFCKAGGYMLLVLLLARFPLYTSSSGYSYADGLVFLLITMFLLALFVFYVPWGRLDSLGDA